MFHKILTRFLSSNVIMYIIIFMSTTQDHTSTMTMLLDFSTYVVVVIELTEKRDVLN